MEKTSLFLTTCSFNLKADIRKMQRALNLDVSFRMHLNQRLLQKIPAYEAKIQIKTLGERGNSKAGPCIILQDTKCQSPEHINRFPP